MLDYLTISDVKFDNWVKCGQQTSLYRMSVGRLRDESQSVLGRCPPPRPSFSVFWLSLPESIISGVVKWLFLILSTFIR